MIIPELDIEQLATADRNQYLLLSSLFYSRYFTQPEAYPIGRARIASFFKRVPIVKHIEAEQGTYGLHNPALTLFSLNQARLKELAQEIKAKRRDKRLLTSNEKILLGKWQFVRKKKCCEL